MREDTHNLRWLPGTTASCRNAALVQSVSYILQAYRARFADRFDDGAQILYPLPSGPLTYFDTAFVGLGADFGGKVSRVAAQHHATRFGGL